MQVRKGVRRIGALMLVLLATGAMADTPSAVEVPSPEAQAEILNLLERQALYRDRMDWPATRVRLQSAQGDPARRLAVLREAIALSTGHHGAWTTTQRQRVSARMERSRANDGLITLRTGCSTGQTRPGETVEHWPSITKKARDAGLYDRPPAGHSGASLTWSARMIARTLLSEISKSQAIAAGLEPRAWKASTDSRMAGLTFFRVTPSLPAVQAEARV